MNHGLHHLLKRRRTGAAHAYDSFMLLVSVMAPLTLVPQILQVFETKSVAGLSPITWALLGSVNILWCVYGYIHKQPPILITNVLMGTLDFIVVFEIFLYR